MLHLNFQPFPVLETKRLLLRQTVMSDAVALQKLRSNPQAMQYINRPLTKTLEDAEKWIGVVLDALAAGTGINWCICLQHQPATHVGNIGIWRIDKENQRGEIGYMLEPSLHGQGFMYEAIQPVLHYGFTVMKLHSIEAQIDPENKASAALLKKAGFTQEAYFKENCFFNGRFSDTAVFSLLAKDWESKSRAIEATDITAT